MNRTEQIKYNHKIEDVAARLGIELKKSGSRFVALCPIHNEKTPSFTIDIQKQVFYCHGCQKGGDLIKLVQYVLDCDFKTALDYLDGGSFEHTYTPPAKRAKPKPVPAPDFLPPELVKKSMQLPPSNFEIGLQNVLTTEGIRFVKSLFNIGASKRNPSAVAFWQIDSQQRVRQLKLTDYDAATLKTKKYNGRKVIDQKAKAIHKASGNDSPNIIPCLFGEQQLKHQEKGATIAIVESEKTAILMTAVLPDMVWMATGGKAAAQFKSPSTLNALRGFNVRLFPDVDALQTWGELADGLRRKGINAEVDYFLQEVATPEMIEAKADLADYYFPVINGRITASDLAIAIDTTPYDKLDIGIIEADAVNASTQLIKNNSKQENEQSNTSRKAQ